MKAIFFHYIDLIENMFFKRIFDIIFSVIGLTSLALLIIILILVSSVDTKSFGIFYQKRIGQFGKVFQIFKIKTISERSRKASSYGLFLRKSKLDELPQLFNILIGDMSFVGPRPDISGYYDMLQGEQRKILQLKPGLTSEASIKYSDEESILNLQENPLEYNDNVIFPDKVKMNLDYFYKQSLLVDLKIILKTVFG